MTIVRDNGGAAIHAPLTLRALVAKLQVRDRSSAVQRARELRLLAAGRTR
jgi:hypothetical protein